MIKTTDELLQKWKTRKSRHYARIIRLEKQVLKLQREIKQRDEQILDMQRRNVLTTSWKL